MLIIILCSTTEQQLTITLKMSLRCIVIIMHWPPFDDTPLLHPFFIHPKVKGFNVIKQVGFMKTHVGKNTLKKQSNKLTYDIPTLKS
jgi:hypothetical protein